MVSLAEGIEKPEQHLFLQQQQCDVGQGYLFAKPVPIDGLENWLAQHLQFLIEALA